MAYARFDAASGSGRDSTFPRERSQTISRINRVEQGICHMPLPYRIEDQSLMTTATLPVDTKDPTNAAILAVSEDKIQGFQTDPFGEISRLSGIDLLTVIERISAMLRAGTIRRVRQTMLATNLAQGALVAWVVPEEKLNATFDWMFQQDPFSGHVVIRSTDQKISASRYRLW